MLRDQRWTGRRAALEQEDADDALLFLALHRSRLPRGVEAALAGGIAIAAAERDKHPPPAQIVQAKGRPVGRVPSTPGIGAVGKSVP